MSQSWNIKVFIVPVQLVNCCKKGITYKFLKIHRWIILRNILGTKRSGMDDPHVVLTVLFLQKHIDNTLKVQKVYTSIPIVTGMLVIKERWTIDRRTGIESSTTSHLRRPGHGSDITRMYWPTEAEIDHCTGVRKRWSIHSFSLCDGRCTTSHRLWEVMINTVQHKWSRKISKTTILIY